MLARVDPSLIETIEESSTLAWISTEALEAVGDALLAELGPDEFRGFYAAHISGWSESRLFGPLSSAAIRIFGSNPTGHLKWLARAWQITTRGMGTLTATEGDGCVTVQYAGLPPKHRVERMVLSSQGSIEGIVRARGKEPSISTDLSKLEDGVFELSVRWD